MNARAGRHAIGCWLAITACAWSCWSPLCAQHMGEHAEPTPPPEVIEETWPAPEVLVKDVNGGTVDATGKIWAWHTLKVTIPVHLPATIEFVRVDASSLVKACKQDSPLPVKGAALLLRDGTWTFWSVPGTGEVWAYDGKVFIKDRSHAILPPDHGWAVGGGKYLFGGEKGVLIFDANTRQFHSALMRDKAVGLPRMAFFSYLHPGSMQSVTDQRGRRFVWCEVHGSIWRLDDVSVPGMGGPYEPRWTEIPVLDSLGHAGLRCLVRDPAGSPAKPLLLANQILLNDTWLSGPYRAGEADIAPVEKGLRSEVFTDRRVALKKLLDDGKDGRWRFGVWLATVEPGQDEAAFKECLKQAILDHAYRFEPGRATDYAVQLSRLGALSEDSSPREIVDYPSLWKALEAAGQLERHRRIEIENRYREYRRGESSQRVLQGNPHLIPVPVNGRVDHGYSFPRAWEGDAMLHCFEERAGRSTAVKVNTIYVCGRNGEVWAIPESSDPIRKIHVSSARGDERAFVSSVLGREPPAEGRAGPGRLLAMVADLGLVALNEPPPKEDEKAAPPAPQE